MFSDNIEINLSYSPKRYVNNIVLFPIILIPSPGYNFKDK